MVGLTLGTGVGGVIAIDGKVHQGHDGTAGEIGHQTIDPDGPDCNCGNHGCLEAFARADRIAEACGTATAEEAVERARNGDAAAIEGLRRVGRYLGIGIGNMITVIAPDVVVIGGGIAPAGDLLLETAREEIRRRVHTTSISDVEIVTAELGTWAGRDRGGASTARRWQSPHRSAAARRHRAPRRDRRGLRPASPPDRAGPPRADHDDAARATGSRRTPSSSRSSGSAG